MPCQVLEVREEAFGAVPEAQTAGLGTADAHRKAEEATRRLTEVVQELQQLKSQMGVLKTRSRMESAVAAARQLQRVRPRMTLRAAQQLVRTWHSNTILVVLNRSETVQRRLEMMLVLAIGQSISAGVRQLGSAGALKRRGTAAQCVLVWRAATREGAGHPKAAQPQLQGVGALEQAIKPGQEVAMAPGQEKREQLKQQESDKLQGMIDGLHSVVGSLRAECEAWTAGNGELRSLNSDLVQQGAALREERAALMSTCEQKLALSLELNAECEMQQEEVQKGAAERAILSQAREEMQQEHARQKQQLTKVEQECATLLKQREELQGEADKENRDAHGLTVARGDVKRQTEELAKTRADLERQTDDLTKTRFELESQTNELASKVKANQEQWKEESAGKRRR